MPPGLDRDAGAAPSLALATVARRPDGAKEEPSFGSVAGTRREPPQATLTQGEVLPRVAGYQPRRARQPSSVAETEPGTPRASAANRLGSGPLLATRSGAGRADQEFEDGAWG